MKQLLLLIFFLFTLPAVSAQFNVTGAKYDENKYRLIAYSAPRTANTYDKVPERASIKQFAPKPGHQANYGTCTAWSVGYAARTILHARQEKISNPSTISEKAFSPGFIYALTKDPSDVNCSEGIYIWAALDNLQSKGIATKGSFSKDCVDMSEALPFLNEAQGFKIAGYNRLFKPESSQQAKIDAVKLALSQGNPVIVGLYCDSCGKSLLKPSNKHVWQATLDGGNVRHAVTVVGYDDQKDGGAFEIMNSWGEAWANNGYIWIKYNDFALNVKEAYEMIAISEKTNTIDLAGSFRLIDLNGKELNTQYNLSYGAPKLVGLQKSQYKVKSQINAGTPYRLLVKNNETAFMYVIGGDKTNEINTLFPYQDENGDYVSAAITGKENEISLPGEDFAFEATSAGGGTDYLAVLYSKEELDINAIIAQVKTTQGRNFAERLSKVLGDRLLKDDNVRFDKTKVSFTAKSKGKDVVMMILEMDIK